MVKYYTEDNIDFFTELYKSLDVEEDNIKTDKDNELCLITNLPLVDKYVTLKCGHKFNYVPLYNDLVKYNTLFIHMETNKKNKKHIRCPYCREEQDELLPYYQELGLKQITGIHTDELINTQAICEFTCDYIVDGNITKFKCKRIANNHNYFYIPNCNNVYCISHQNVILRQYKKKLLDAKKGELKQEKIKLKEEEKKKKQLEKEKKKEESKIKKQLEKNKMTQNNNTDSSNNILNENVCIMIMKSGTRKGLQCGCKVYKNNICKRHYTLQNKEQNKDINNECVNDDHVNNSK